MAIDPCIANSFLDSCSFDPKYAPEDSASLEILELHREERVSLHVAHSTQKEIDHPNTPEWVKAEAQSLIFTIDVGLTPNEFVILRKIESILAGNGKLENIAQDARHVFEAQKYGSYFISTDTKILNRAHPLRSCCQVEIVRPSEFLALVSMHGR